MKRTAAIRRVVDVVEGSKEPLYILAAIRHDGCRRRVHRTSVQQLLGRVDVDEGFMEPLDSVAAIRRARR